MHEAGSQEVFDMAREKDKIKLGQSVSGRVYRRIGNLLDIARKA